MPASRFKGGMLVMMLLMVSIGLRAEQPRIALVIDDMGFQQHRDQAIMALDSRVVVAIIPDAPMASHLARQARVQGREALVHLPLSGLGPDNCEPELTCMGSDWAVKRMAAYLSEAFETVEGAVGFNNHQGSRFTGDRHAVARLVAGVSQLEYRLGRPLLVLDSRTSPTTVLEQEARNVGLVSARRHVFLDHSDRVEDIEQAWDALIAMAHERGQAIAIGHPRPNTLKVLERRLPELEPDGVELVTLTELVCPSTGAELVSRASGCRQDVRGIPSGAYEGLPP